MKLKSLHIDLNSSYEPNPGKYTARMSWEAGGGTTEVVLEPEVSEKLLAFIGPVIVEFSHAAAKSIANNIQFSVEEARRGPQIDVATTSSGASE